jgi:diguanylate cyclase (GGDEF)-like protein
MLAGGLLAAITAVLPPAATGSQAVILVVGGMSAVIGAVLLTSRPYLSERALGAVAVGGTVVITLATREGGAIDEVLFLWVCLFAFYFLSLPHALGQAAIVGIAYAWILHDQPGSTNEAVSHWVVTMATLIVAGILISQLRGNVYGVVDELSERASVDSLTGLLNRSSLEERFAVERARSDRDQTPISVLAIDIDRFKGANDAHGHPVGDQVLRHVSAALRHWTRRVDVVARVGGDEFAVVLAGAATENALSVAEDIRAAIAQSPGPHELQITVSIGVTSAEGEIPAFSELWLAADAAMYEAKRSGGDRTHAQDIDGNPINSGARPVIWDPRPPRAGAGVGAGASAGQELTPP